MLKIKNLIVNFTKNAWNKLKKVNIEERLQEMKKSMREAQVQRNTSKLDHL